MYQYFPNKRAIFIALHERHIVQVDGMIRRCMADGADATLDEFISLLIAGMIELHRADPELSELLQAEVPHRAAGTPSLSERLYGPLRKALDARARELGGTNDGRTSNLDMQAFFLSNMIEAFGHAIVQRRPA